MSGFGTFYRLKVGDLRHSCKLQRRVVSSTDDRGRDVDTWETIRTIKCAIKNLQSNEIERARQLVPEATHRIFTRAGGELSSQMRILFGTRVFYVGPIDDMENVGRFVSIIAAEDLSGDPA